MGLFDKLFNKKKGAEEAADDLPQFLYRMAYFFLPPFFFNEPQRVLGYFSDENIPAGAFLYVMACKMQQIEPSTEAAKSFSGETGQLSSGAAYYIIQYPTPKPLPTNTIGGKGYVLAPYFSAMVYDEAANVRDYYVLGQRPFGGTSLRKVTPEVNANLGEGPEPTLSALIDVLEKVYKPA